MKRKVSIAIHPSLVKKHCQRIARKLGVIVQVNFVNEWCTVSFQLIFSKTKEVIAPFGCGMMCAN
jgi:hypothetical protein